MQLPNMAFLKELTWPLNELVLVIHGAEVDLILFLSFKSVYFIEFI
jgi:hypothetical protein